jgi:2-iminobutanoate/2-iminopropanoate deaminase
MKSIHSNEAPAAIGPYSQATRTGVFVFTSGQLGLVPETGMLAEGGIAAQTRQALTNLSKVLETAGLTMRHVVKTTVFLADMSDFAAMNEVYATFFAEPFPARSAVAVKSLPKGGLVEIECIACEAL